MAEAEATKARAEKAAAERAAAEEARWQGKKGKRKSAGKGKERPSVPPPAAAAPPAAPGRRTIESIRANARESSRTGRGSSAALAAGKEAAAAVMKAWGPCLQAEHAASLQFMRLKKVWLEEGRGADKEGAMCLSKLSRCYAKTVFTPSQRFSSTRPTPPTPAARRSARRPPGSRSLSCGRRWGSRLRAQVKGGGLQACWIAVCTTLRYSRVV